MSTSLPQILPKDRLKEKLPLKNNLSRNKRPELSRKFRKNKLHRLLNRTHLLKNRLSQKPLFRMMTPLSSNHQLKKFSQSNNKKKLRLQLQPSRIGFREPPLLFTHHRQPQLSLPQ
jgi:hypothetical protein